MSRARVSGRAGLRVVPRRPQDAPQQTTTAPLVLHMRHLRGAHAWHVSHFPGPLQPWVYLVLSRHRDPQYTGHSRIVGAAQRLLREGIESGVFRPVNVPHMVQSIIGATVFHFASGEFGEEIIGRPLFSGTEVRRRKQEVKALIRHGLVLAPLNIART